ncbi:DUF2254 domain-containing protein [Sphingomonas montana]|uniref:DUF2254 domain-containing protein n=1 Tax=Sphingomonas montana TaxID=1843236 RepID=UPI00096EA254|nr:DUF2254 domain-containing protein [Sphingomonas montana]
MKALVLRLSVRLRESYWVIPAIMAITAVLLAGGMIALDTYEGSGWMDGFSWLHASRPSGARQLLSAIGGSMITVAGTVFSVTIAAVVYASGQYGPRLLSNFMADRGNQVTLGTFIATFLYCLIVLRTVRSPEESDGIGFVPNMAVLVAVLLAVCSIAVLIFFIHHVPSKLHINSVIKDIGDTLIKEVGQRFPNAIGAARPERNGQPEKARVPPAFRDDATPQAASERFLIAALHTGYIQTVDADAITAQARANDLVLRLRYQPGDFVHVGRTLVEATPPGRCDATTAKAIAEAYAVGARRTAIQDLRFLVDELVEIGARALSAGINDPFTAITCLDWLAAALADLACREMPSPLRIDAAGALRVIAHLETFAGFMDRSFGALIPYVAGDVVVGLRFVRALGEVALDCDAPDRLACVKATVDRLAALSKETLTGSSVERLVERCDELRNALRAPDFKRRLRDGTTWLAGSA